MKPYESTSAQVMEVLLQKGAADCGLYCLDYCVSLACKEDPCSCVYSQAEMRIHLLHAYMEQ